MEKNRGRFVFRRSVEPNAEFTARLTVAYEARIAAITADTVMYSLAENTGATLSEIPQAAMKGLPYRALTIVAEAMDVEAREFAANLVGITASTLRRRRHNGWLRPSESDAFVRYARLVDAAKQLMEGDEAGLCWLNTPVSIFGGQSPQEYARTEAGAREVFLLITRLEHSVYS